MMRKISYIAAWAVYAVWLSTALCLTQPERKIVERALAQAEIAKGANTLLKSANELLGAEAEQARISATNANSVAMMAATSAFTTGLRARAAEKDAILCKQENDRMRPVYNAVKGPWWFPGLNALIYGIKKSSISLLVIIAGVVVILVIIKLTTGLSFGAMFNPIIKFFSKIPGWIGRAGKAAKDGLSKLKRKPKD